MLRRILHYETHGVDTPYLLSFRSKSFINNNNAPRDFFIITYQVLSRIIEISVTQIKTIWMHEIRLDHSTVPLTS